MVARTNKYVKIKNNVNILNLLLRCSVGLDVKPMVSVMCKSIMFMDTCVDNMKQEFINQISNMVETTTYSPETTTYSNETTTYSTVIRG